MQRARGLDQNRGAAVLFAGKLVQPEGFECGTELRRQNRDFGFGVLVKTGVGHLQYERDSAHHLPGNQQRRGHGGMSAALRQPGIASGVHVVEEERAAFLHRFQGDRGRGRRIAGAQACAAKRLGLIAVGFGPGQLTARGIIPKIGSAGLEERPRQDAERPDEMARIAALKSGPR
jgi:hypothetical protein